MNCTMTYPDAIEAIKSKAKKMKMTGKELAKASEISASYLSRLFSFEREADDQTLIKLAQAVKLNPLEILRIANRIPFEPSDNDELDKQIMYLLKLLPYSEKEKFAKRLELETQFYERPQPARTTNKTRS